MCDVGDVLTKVFSPVIGFSGQIGSALSRAITPPGTGGAQALMQQQNQLAADTLTFAKQQQADAATRSDAALAAQKTANDIARAASLPAADSDSARLAADARLRRLLSASPFGVKAGLKNLGDAPVGFRTATGA